MQPHIQVNLNPDENLHVVQEEAKDNNPRNPDPPNQPFQQPRSQVITIRNEDPRLDFLINGTDEKKLKQKVSLITLEYHIQVKVQLISMWFNFQQT